MKIGDTWVDISHPDIQAAKNVNDLKKLGIFDKTEDEHYKKLLEAKQPVVIKSKIEGSNYVGEIVNNNTDNGEL